MKTLTYWKNIFSATQIPFDKVPIEIGDKVKLSKKSLEEMVDTGFYAKHVYTILSKSTRFGELRYGTSAGGYLLEDELELTDINAEDFH